ncbi:TSA family protein [Seiridium cupressi]
MSFRALSSLPRALSQRAAPLRAAPALSRVSQFHTSRPLFVSPGDTLPQGELLFENSPGNKVDLSDEFTNIKRGLVIGVPAAFSPSCSNQHIPSYINSPKVAEIIGEGGKVAVVSVNDPFVMKAWQDQLDPTNESGIRFLADASGDFTKALELDFDSVAIFGNRRAKRYALVLEDGKVKSVHVEPDNTGTDVTLADKVLG